MKIAFVLKGMTFMRSLGTLIYFARKKNFDITIYLAKNNKGLERNALKASQFSELVPEAEIATCQSELDIVASLKKRGINNVICQDASHHAAHLCLEPTMRVFSIAVFIDTLHYAWRVKKGKEKSVLPYKIYFPCTYIENKFFFIGAFNRSNLRYATLGSPLLDHALFVADKTHEKSVVYIAPPSEMMGLRLRIRLKNLFRHIKSNGFAIIAKDRIKTPLDDSLKRYCDEIHSSESLLPYTSIKLISQSSLHICGYSTSIFEARHLNKPTLNLDINISKASMPGFITNYNITGLYNSLTCKTSKKSLKHEFDTLINTKCTSFSENKEYINPNNSRTMSDNASVRILDDIYHEAQK